MSNDCGHKKREYSPGGTKFYCPDCEEIYYTETEELIE